MYILTRETTVRKPINQYGRLGYVKVIEQVVTDDVDAFQKGKRIKYAVREITQDELNAYLATGKTINQEYQEDVEVVSRYAGSRYMRGH